MEAVTFESPRLETYHSDQAKFNPKRSLIGTSLERVTERELDEFRHMEMDKLTNLPHQHKTLDLSNLRQSYENQKIRLQQADEEYKKSQAKAFSFQVKKPQCINNPSTRIHASRELMELIKPTRPQPTNTTTKFPYQIMGDVFCSAPDFQGSGKERAVDDSPRYGRRSSVKNIGYTSDFLAHQEAMPQNFNQNCDNGSEHNKNSIVTLPRNIRHSFGSRLCDDLLSDGVKVGQTLEKHQQERRPRTRLVEEVPSTLEVPLSAYEGLGLNTRVNIFPGQSPKNQASATKTNFNDSVYLKREPDPDEFRMKRDELSSWSEENIIRDKESRQWVEYQDSLPKHVITWDRTATLPPKPIPKPIPTAKKKKTKTKEIVKPQEKSVVDEDEFVFITPPLTPPPVPLSPAILPQSFQRDDDFWEFFDQQTPK